MQHSEIAQQATAHDEVSPERVQFVMNESERIEMSRAADIPRRRHFLLDHPRRVVNLLAQKSHMLRVGALNVFKGRC